ncbi:unnamed protein product [Ceratitis capitata]|uniref:(Mediterranean fruit fly) hypothetical protein n=1 Tax=Ceratitis capitata TaxID=7213 RepID=A0A811UM96_CERCA|nr:unnamed protein product [Ceratitis capitata]
MFRSHGEVLACPELYDLTRNWRNPIKKVYTRCEVYYVKDQNCKPEKEQGRPVVPDLVKDLRGRNVLTSLHLTSWGLNY